MSEVTVGNIREFKFDFRYQQQVVRLRCVRKKHEDNCIGSRHCRSQLAFGSRGYRLSISWINTRKLAKLRYFIVF